MKKLMLVAAILVIVFTPITVRADHLDMLEWYKPLHGKVCAVEAIMWHNPPMAYQPSTLGEMDGRAELQCTLGTVVLPVNFVYPGPIPPRHYYYEIELPLDWSALGFRDSCVINAQIWYKDTTTGQWNLSRHVPIYNEHYTICRKVITGPMLKNKYLLSNPYP